MAMHKNACCTTPYQLGITFKKYFHRGQAKTKQQQKGQVIVTKYQLLFCTWVEYFHLLKCLILFCQEPHAVYLHSAFSAL